MEVHINLVFTICLSNEWAKQGCGEQGSLPNRNQDFLLSFEDI